MQALKLTNYDQPLSLQTNTLEVLVAELGEECQNVLTLIHQLQLPSLSLTQKVDILAELNAAIIHLHAHCNEDFQDLIAEEIEQLPGDRD
jgi:hypothetical protein